MASKLSQKLTFSRRSSTPSQLNVIDESSVCPSRISLGENAQKAFYGLIEAVRARDPEHPVEFHLKHACSADQMPETIPDGAPAAATPAAKSAKTDANSAPGGSKEAPIQLDSSS